MVGWTAEIPAGMLWCGARAAPLTRVGGGEDGDGDKHRTVAGGAGPEWVSGAPIVGSPSPGHGLTGVLDPGHGPRSGVCLAVPLARVLRV